MANAIFLIFKVNCMSHRCCSVVVVANSRSAAPSLEARSHQFSGAPLDKGEK